jgi:hypothetical protein
MTGTLCNIEISGGAGVTPGTIEATHVNDVAQYTLFPRTSPISRCEPIRYRRGSE